MKAVFPGVPASLRMICQFGLASMLFHKSFLQQSLPTNHLLFATPLFNTRNESQFEWLRRRVVCRNFQEHDPISPSGIPPHVGIMVALTNYKEKIDGIKEGLVVDFEKALKRHINGSVMTMEAMETAFAAVLARPNLMRPNLPAPDPEGETAVNATATMHTELYTWGGGFHRVPREFVLPPGTVRVVWQQWCAGQPPLRQLSKHDMASRLQKIRLAELQRLMRLVEALLTSDEVL
ncbi:hypothetical protein PHYSODRAFT_494237 [Phytophthora sojae]|uniref:Uncharacterized protein n=1 Tax=Phytophthora sojae (strain P6497) TaxID=1094619 RepID=G4Z7W0_PHYSP|nr:hypothetical protein PHYSODRAFT_494237 [Phytophthora sojae]EGZ22495.1 hypothetical protein PHYSODRAFT_494237 [Phytophthora sojae]|eukprot:XP_009525212.1 hypothetical protein PHYSODRAFT_494237 [Phytophthora sojae]